MSIENLIGTGYDNDTLVGDGGSNVIDGLAGKDSLQGGGGNDVLRGGTGADKLDGGAGNDTASWYTSAAGVTVDLAAGTGTGDASGDTFVDIENLTGSGKGGDTLSGSAGATSWPAGAATTCSVAAQGPTRWTAAAASTPPATTPARPE